MLSAQSDTLSGVFFKKKIIAEGGKKQIYKTKRHDSANIIIWLSFLKSLFAQVGRLVRGILLDIRVCSV